MGEGTTRRQPRPESSVTDQPRASARRRARPSEKKGPIGLVGFPNAGSSASTTTWVTTAATARRAVGGHQGVADGLRDQVAELALGHRAEHEQGLRRHLAADRLLGHRERPHLRSVAVHDQQPVAPRHDADGGPGDEPGPLLLVREVTQAGRRERVPADRQDDRLAQGRLLLVAAEHPIDACVRRHLHGARREG